MTQAHLGILCIHEPVEFFVCNFFSQNRLISKQKRLQKLIFFLKGPLIVTDYDENNNFLVFPCWIQKQLLKEDGGLKNCHINLILIQISSLAHNSLEGAKFMQNAVF